MILIDKQHTTETVFDMLKSYLVEEPTNIWKPKDDYIIFVGKKQLTQIISFENDNRLFIHYEKSGGLFYFDAYLDSEFNQSINVYERLIT